MSLGSDHLDQLRLTRIGLKIPGGTRADLKVFRRYKKYDLPQTSSCIGLHFMQQQPRKMQDREIHHFVTLVVPCFLGFQYWFPVSRCNSRSLHLTIQRFPVQFSLRPTFLCFFFPIFSFSSILFFCIIFDFFMKKPHILVFFKRKGKQLLGVDHFTFEGGLGYGVEDLRKKILQSLLNREKHCPVRKKIIAQTNSSTLSPPPPHLVKWTKLINGRMDCLVFT